MKKLISGLIGVVFVLAALPALAGEVWTFPVTNKEPALAPPTDPDIKSIPGTYTALDPSKVTKKWHLCVNMPNMADPYYVAVNYGAVEEAKRLGIKMTMTTAGGYVNLAKQITQIEDCIAQGADAVLPMAISPTGLNKVVAEARKQGVVVIDMGNGMDSPDINARYKVSYYDAGVVTAKYLIGRHPKGSGTAEVLWLPGPPGAGWAEDVNRGFHDTLAELDSDVVAVATLYGDSHKEVQMKLVEDGLQTYPDIAYIVGMASAAEGGIQILKEMDRTDIKLVSHYMTVGMWKGILDGTIEGAITDSGVFMPRMAMDQAVRILEGYDYLEDTGAEAYMIDSSNIGSVDRNESLAPDGFDPIFNID